MSTYQSVYVAFDVFPGAKGAATHIYHMSHVLSDFLPKCALLCLGNDDLPEFQEEQNLDIFRFRTTEANYLRRAEMFTAFVYEWVQENPHVKLAHFRDIWGGLALLGNLNAAKYVFEVNALTSVELPYKYDLLPETIAKIESLEAYCLHNANVIITPSEVTRNFLQEKGIESSVINVISNGAEIPEKLEKPADAPEKYIMYLGALQAWQGIPVLLKAFEGLRDFQNLYLLIASSHNEKQSKMLIKLAAKLQISERIIWKHQLNKVELAAYLQHAYLSIAPLEDTPRNTLQGCSPLKVYESMACSVPVVASDLPVLHEIIENKVNGRLFTPGNHFELSRTIRILLDFPEVRNKLAEKAFQTIATNHTWQHKYAKLLQLYTNLLTFPTN